MKPEEEVLLCAKASVVIYGTDADPDGYSSYQPAMAALGFGRFVPFDFPTRTLDFRAFFCSSDEYNLLAFRGTKTPQDWMTDIACLPIHFESVFAGYPAIGEIHTGFARCLAEGLQRVVLPLQHADRDKPLLITGHSLGGALAALAGVCFTVSNAPIPRISAIYTFGQPRLGLQPFCDEYKRQLAGKLVRFINSKDIVPRVPLRLSGYVDVGTVVHFDSEGEPSLEAAEWRNFLEKPFTNLAQVLEMAAQMNVEMGEHSVTGYKRLIETNQDEIGELLATAARAAGR